MAPRTSVLRRYALVAERLQPARLDSPFGGSRLVQVRSGQSGRGIPRGKSLACKATPLLLGVLAIEKLSWPVRAGARGSPPIHPCISRVQRDHGDSRPSPKLELQRLPF